MTFRFEQICHKIKKATKMKIYLMEKAHCNTVSLGKVGNKIEDACIVAYTGSAAKSE